MSTQPPVRYENYPPDDSASPAGATDGTPGVQAYLPATVRPALTNAGSSRRTVLVWVIGLSIVGIAGAVALRSDSGDDTGESEFSVGDYSSTAPAGWTVYDDGSGTVVVTNGTNVLAAVTVDTATSSLAVEEIADLAKSHYEGFTGKIGDVVDRSSGDLQHATMDGTGKYLGMDARLMAELWIDDTGAGLLVVRVLTAQMSSTVAVEAQDMVDELSGDF